MYVVGLEVSTSSAKAVLYSLQAEVIAESTKPLADTISQVTWQEPKGILQAALACLSEVTEGYGKYVQAIGLSGIWHSLLLLDENREPLGPIRTWADVAWSSGMAKNPSLVAQVYAKTGCLDHGMYPFWKLYGMREKNYSPLGQAKYLSSQIEYLFEQLTNEIAVSACTASGSGLFNIHTLKWDQELLDSININPKMLPRIEEADYSAPLSSTIARKIGLKAGIPVTIGSADGALNQIGSGGLKAGVMTFSVGTSGALRITSPKSVLAKEANTWCYYLLDGRRLAGVATHATSNLDWFMTNFNLQQYGHTTLAKEAQELSSLDGPYFLPFIYGERAPGWQEERSGGFYGIKARHSTAHLYRAVLEGILFALYHSYQNLTEVVGLPDTIYLSGGIIHSFYWRQLASDIFGKRLITTGVIHESTLGAALLALKAAGVLGDVEEYNPPISGEIVPDANKHSDYQERYQVYLEYYNKGW